MLHLEVLRIMVEIGRLGEKILDSEVGAKLL